jgi:hypothetical protein
MLPPLLLGLSYPVALGRSIEEGRADAVERANDKKAVKAYILCVDVESILKDQLKARYREKEEENEMLVARKIQ